MSSEKLQSLQKLPARKLKEMCRDANMKVSGTKNQLLMRLCGVEKEQPQVSLSVEKPKTRMSEKSVNEWLEKQGVDDMENVSKCLRAGIKKGCIDISGDSPLDNVVVVDSCYHCQNELKVTIRDVLYQPDNPGGDYESACYDATVQCTKYDDCGGLYVSNMCRRKKHITVGKFYNHCTFCPGFGQCIGDYREEHCDTCGKHFWAGAGSGRCSCGGSNSDEDSNSSDEERRLDDVCILS